jgi:sulfopyruvate decarboxylase alpha subunit
VGAAGDPTISLSPNSDETGSDELTGVQWHQDVLDGLKANNIRLIAHVADRVLAPIIRLMEADPHFEVVTLTREEEGIGILTGAYLGGIRGALLLQASGLGNTLNAFGSLAIPYQIPFPILISQRGSFGEHNLVQLAMGRGVPRVLDALGIQVFDMVRPEDVRYTVEMGTKHAIVSRRPVGLTLTTRLSGGALGSH